MSLIVGAAETAKPFAEATCQALQGLVLRCSNLLPERAPPADLVSSLQRLAEEDSALAAWVGQVLDSDVFLQVQRSASASASCVTDGVWACIAAQLPELLIQHTTPRIGTDDGQTSAVHRSHQLLPLCHAVARLRSLELRFAAELQRQKREALYQFAYGLSHELNNPLANIATRAGVLHQQESHPQRKTLLEAIIANAMRGCEMLGDLMLVARPPQLHFASLAIGDVVEPVVEQARQWASGRNIEVIYAGHSTANVQLDSAAMREALWALLRNALEAMPEGGTVSLTISDTETGRVCIEIADHGCSLSAAALEYCFDPYYSGREAGRGLGLGLSKAQRIVTLHAGELTLTNRSGGGAIARVVLPSESL